MADENVLDRLAARLSFQMQALYDEREQLLDGAEKMIEQRFSATRDEYEAAAKAMHRAAEVVALVEDLQAEKDALDALRSLNAERQAVKA
jgi:hypothetical protein